MHQSCRIRSWPKISAASRTTTSPTRSRTSPASRIQRTRGGEGQYVNVRGLGPEFSIVTLNGRILATDGDGREFAFDVLPSEVITGADVYKSASAVNLEGSIGGAINLTSARPLDTPRHARVALGRRRLQRSLREDRLQGERRVQQHLRGRSHGRDADGDLSGHRGALRRRARVLHQSGLARASSTPTATATISADESDLLGLCCTSFGARIQHKQRTGVTGVWQWDVERQLPHDRRWPVHAARMRRPSAITSRTTSRTRSSMKTPARIAGATSASAITGSTA